MDIVDRLIFDRIAELKSSFFNDFTTKPITIGDFDGEKIYEAIVLLIWQCDPSTRSIIASSKLPVAMTARFRSANIIAQAIKKIGVHHEIGYQTLLYGQTKELRNIFISLIEKLPIYAQEVVSDCDSRTQLIREAVSTSLDSKVHALLRTKLFNGVQPTATSWEIPRRVSYTGFSGDVKASLQNSDWRYKSRALICSLIEKCFYDQAEVFATPLCCEVGERSNDKPKPLRKPPLLPKPCSKILKPVLAEETCSKKSDTKDCTTPSESSHSELSHQELSRMEPPPELEILREYQSSLERKAALLNKQKLECLSAEQSLDEMKIKLGAVDMRLVKLLKEPDAVGKLMEFIARSEERMEQHQSQWHKAKVEKLRELMDIQKDSDVSSVPIREEISALRQEIEETEVQLAKKQSNISSLKKESDETLDSKVDRHFYIKHILEIISNIKRQQNEIQKVIDANNAFSKEIQSLHGKLDRTFIAVEEHLHSDARIDLLMRKGYRLLVKIHQECSKAVETIELSGQLSREIDEINWEIDIMQQKGIDQMLEKLLEDWTVLKEENKHLQGKLKMYPAT